MQGPAHRSVTCKTKTLHTYRRLPFTVCSPTHARRTIVVYKLGSSRVEPSVIVGTGAPEAQAPREQFWNVNGTAAPQRMSAADRLKLMAALQQESHEALAAVGIEDPRTGYRASAHDTVDVRMYDGLMKARDRLATKLSDVNKYVAHLEQRLIATEGDAEAAYDIIRKVVMELGAMSRLAESAAASLQFGVDPVKGVDPLIKLADRLVGMQEVVAAERDKFKARVVTRVPITWIGVASEVRLMGDFDGWTNGHELSAPDVETDSVYKTFEGVVPLLPGRYSVKFLVDGLWACTGDWPCETTPTGELNNILVVN